MKVFQIYHHARSPNCCNYRFSSPWGRLYFDFWCWNRLPRRHPDFLPFLPSRHETPALLARMILRQWFFQADNCQCACISNIFEVPLSGLERLLRVKIRSLDRGPNRRRFPCDLVVLEAYHSSTSNLLSPMTLKQALEIIISQKSF